MAVGLSSTLNRIETFFDFRGTLVKTTIFLPFMDYRDLIIDCSARFLFYELLYWMNNICMVSLV